MDPSSLIIGAEAGHTLSSNNEHSYILNGHTLI